MNLIEQFRQEVQANIAALGADAGLRTATLEWIQRANEHRYTYNFTWAGRPIIQYPQDIVAMQELIWRVKPDLIIETGIAHGGSLVFSASMLALLDLAEATQRNAPLTTAGPPARRVIGVDIDIRAHNRAEIESSPFARYIAMIQGSSIDPAVVEQVWQAARGFERVMVCLDSNHTHAHVLAELEAYAPLTSPGSYCVVFDTLIEDMPDDMFHDRPWNRRDNPKTAVFEYLERLESRGARAADGAPLRFEIDRDVQHKLLITVAPEGYLKRIGGA